MNVLRNSSTTSHTDVSLKYAFEKITSKICHDILPLYIKSRIEKQACNIVLPK